MFENDKNKMLELAHIKFEDKKYNISFNYYSLILNEYPELEEAKIGLYLSDIGEEHSDEAQALFDYYHLIKDEKDENAIEIIEALIDSIGLVSETIAEKEIEYEDGISYTDFRKLIESRGSFRRAFEDIMFSTKVIIRDKSDFIGFIMDLNDGGFRDMALKYLDNAPTLFGDDQAIYSLYETLEERK